MVQFEVLLAMDVVPRDLQKNSRMLFNNYTLDLLIASYPSLGRAYFNSLLDGYLTPQQIGKVDIIVQEPRYFRSLDSIFEDQKATNNLLISAHSLLFSSTSAHSLTSLQCASFP